jgi:hypothetical protein
MTTESIIQKINVVLDYDDNSNYSNSNIMFSATDEQIYQFAKSVNSIQNKALKSVRKIITSTLSEV